MRSLLHSVTRHLSQQNPVARALGNSQRPKHCPPAGESALSDSEGRGPRTLPTASWATASCFLPDLPPGLSSQTHGACARPGPPRSPPRGPSRASPPSPSHYVLAPSSPLRRGGAGHTMRETPHPSRQRTEPEPWRSLSHALYCTPRVESSPLTPLVHSRGPHRDLLLSLKLYPRSHRAY